MRKKLDKNMNNLKNNDYPGRGVLIGQTPDKNNIVQVYWIMGRSQNSRNRIFVKENKFLKNKVYNESKVVDTSLIIYYPMKHFQNKYIVTNGDQTDTIHTYIKNGKTFEDALKTRTYEPDKPNFTPRISGIVDLESNAKYKYKISILKTLMNNKNIPVNYIYRYENFISGAGHCITTYESNGEPLPSFKGEPYILPIYNSIEKNIKTYWNTLNDDNKISLAVKFINLENNEQTLKIINKNK